MDLDLTICPICKESVDDSRTASTLTERGLNSLKEAIKQRKDTNVLCSLSQKIHNDCRKRYTDPRAIETFLKKDSENKKKNPTPSLRSAKPFSFKKDCLFCANEVNFDGKSQAERSFQVRTIEFKDTLLQKCTERDDDWATDVRARVLSVHDLHAADAIYHHACCTNFMINKNLPSVDQTEEQLAKRPKLGRLQNSDTDSAFLKIASFLEENDDEQITINDLISMMNDLLKDSEEEAYSYRHMKRKLDEYFGDRIILTNINGKVNVVTFRAKAKTVLHDFYKDNQKKSDPEQEKIRLIRTAAKLIKEDIKSVQTDHTKYPSFEEMKNVEEGLNFLPESLKTLLNGLVIGKNSSLKVASIGQCIMQAARPRVLHAPLQIGLGVQMHHHFSSRFLIDSLHNHGFSCSYQEVKQFEENSALAQGTTIDNSEGKFIQYSADNVDHNIRTLDGHNTFHGMGMIAAVTPQARIKSFIPRQKVSQKDIIQIGRIQIHYHSNESQGMSSITYQKFYQLKFHDPTFHLDTVWKTSVLFGKPRPLWSGYMQLVHQSDHPGKASVIFLPMIDLQPSDPTCIYSTLIFISNHAREHNVTPIVTFDQPLWWKALGIILAEPKESDLKSIVLRLGGLHTEMSFLGSVGYLMSGSGIEQVLETIFAGNTVEHILSGKAIARAVRGHLLIDGVLNGLLLSEVFNIPLSKGARVKAFH
jgi:hypothetical protein